MQKVVVVEMQSHFHKDIEEPFQSFLEQGWKIDSIHCSAATMNESKAACWITAVMEKEGPAPAR